jgi:hypothetical protein
MGISYNPRIVTDGLVLALDAGNTKSYPGSGTTWGDLSGNGNNGTLTNGVGYDSSNLGSLVFDGVDDVIPVSKTSNLATVQDYTIFCFIYPQSLPSINADAIVDTGSGTSFPVRFVLKPNSTIKIQHIAAFLDPGLETTQTIPLNSWSCVAATNSSNFGSVYINGSISTSGSLNQNWDAFDPTIGWKPIGNASNVNPFNGYFGVVQIYNRALTASEIQQNFNALRGRFGI